MTYPDIRIVRLRIAARCLTGDYIRNSLADAWHRRIGNILRFCGLPVFFLCVFQLCAGVRGQICVWRCGVVDVLILDVERQRMLRGVQLLRSKVPRDSLTVRRNRIPFTGARHECGICVILEIVGNRISHNGFVCHVLADLFCNAVEDRLDVVRRHTGAKVMVFRLSARNALHRLDRVLVTSDAEADGINLNAFFLRLTGFPDSRNTMVCLSRLAVVGAAVIHAIVEIFGRCAMFFALNCYSGITVIKVKPAILINIAVVVDNKASDVCNISVSRSIVLTGGLEPSLAADIISGCNKREAVVRLTVAQDNHNLVFCCAGFQQLARSMDASLRVRA